MGSPAARLSDPTVHGGSIVVGCPTVIIGGKPAARIGDLHACPLNTAGVPHVGGPLVFGSPTVWSGFMPQSRVGDPLVCVGPPDAVAAGCPTVIVGLVGGGAGLGGILMGLIEAVEMGFIGDVIAAATAPVDAKAIWRAQHKDAIEQALKDQQALLQSRKDELDRWNDADKAHFKTWFGADDDATRDKMKARIDREMALSKKMTVDNFSPADPPKDKVYAYVYPDDTKHTVYLDSAFHSAPATGQDSKAGTLAHEMSHFDDIGGTKDNQYGASGCKTLAEKDPDAAQNNADSFEYYTEGAP